MQWLHLDLQWLHDVIVVRHLLINTSLLLQMCEEKNSSTRLRFFNQITHASLCSCKIFYLIASPAFFFSLIRTSVISFSTISVFCFVVFFVPNQTIQFVHSYAMLALYFDLIHKWSKDFRQLWLLGIALSFSYFTSNISFVLLIKFTGFNFASTQLPEVDKYELA